MKLADIIRAALPTASDELCEYILWDRTPYPAGEITARSLYSAARRYQRAKDSGITLCDFCDNMATIGSLCPDCAKALNQSAGDHP